MKKMILALSLLTSAGAFAGTGLCYSGGYQNLPFTRVQGPTGLSLAVPQGAALLYADPCPPGWNQAYPQPD